MSDQPLVTQEIQDALDGKGETKMPPITGNQRIIEEMQANRTGPDDQNLILIVDQNGA